MKHLLKILGFIVLISLSVSGCNLPTGDTSAISEITVTPNYTLTTLFQPPENIATKTISVSDLSTATSQIINSTSTETVDNVIEGTTTQTVTYTPTGTQTPTHTQTSTYQAPAICYRSGERFEAIYFSSPPVIDGVWDEWTSTQYPVTYVFYGADNWSGEGDLGSSFRVGWDMNYLYIAAKVGDDQYVQNATGQDIYKGDSLEILLDANLCGDYYDTDINSGDDYQVGISPGNPDVNGSKEAFMWFPSSQAGSRTKVIISSVSSNGLYRVEAAIPWSLFGIYPVTGMTYGFSFSVSDNDDPTQNVQQTMVIGVVTRRLTNPTTWGTLILK